ncbi:hypothetical protein A2468_07960 [Candidatus Falkowbacteria bacterium RIFOXYC2_FULL_46_15]|uniref:Uncharacterized protein n=1 Tax=Candidatus Falkowbacteria bacterium RIFOXYA2_FULL_47_19 TaxID=1797994 RepID=A0A1F5SL39_9BACT|nr:MAG: hypothetical protein A2227_02235 [Candidatus Falkowbacteria bacterium RIFOXYA2_FULL_47_19]OGF36888.1 MAG: hypothetical protein A2468_07960 [Candidatus Falkowbacteria bacterium RIFOXYC2_FULL_46_15]
MKNTFEPKFSLTEKEINQASDPDKLRAKINIANEKLKINTEENRDEAREKEMTEIMEYDRNKFSTLKEYIEELVPNIETWNLSEKQDFIDQIESLKKKLLAVTGEEAGNMIAGLDEMKKKVMIDGKR